MMTAPVLALGTRNNAPYHPFGDREARFSRILSGICALECTDDPRALLSLEGFRGVLCYLDQWKEPPERACAEALCSFVEGGGGLLLLHNGICIQSDPDLEGLIGGFFLGHPEQEALTFSPVGALEGMAPFTVKEEPYRFRLDDPGEIILTYLQGGETYPAGWRSPRGRGRVAFLCPGHTGEVFDIPEYRDLIRAEMLWCLHAEG